MRTNLTTELSRIDANVSSRLADGTYVSPDNTGINNLLSRLTAVRAGYLDKLNVSGTLAHSDDANTYKAAPAFTSSDRAALLALPTLAQMEGSSTIAKEATVSLLPTDDAIALAVESRLATELSEIKSAAIAARNNAAAGL